MLALYSIIYYLPFLGIDSQLVPNSNKPESQRLLFKSNPTTHQSINNKTCLIFLHRYR